MSTISARWTVPVLGVGFAALFFVLLAVNGHVGEGVAAGALMLGYTALLVAGTGRSQYVRMLRGQNDDERTAVIEQRAGLIAGQVVLGAILIGFVQSLARDIDPMPYTWLAAVSGLTYLIALAVLRQRS